MNRNALECSKHYTKNNKRNARQGPDKTIYMFCWYSTLDSVPEKKTEKNISDRIFQGSLHDFWKRRS